ncbi:MAG TPA: TadE family protein [Acidimicrobiales bacterium]|jgi:Flp pilus assembly protein TadG|nr:TadE family protein [Acidimicrobiales bacterium]
MAGAGRARGRFAARGRGESGASLVEFALVLPVFFMVVLGLFTGGLAYTRRLAITDAVRESARYGATLPLSTEATLDAWLQRVGSVVVATADGELDPGESGSRICIAYVPGSGTARRMERVGTASPVFTNGDCFSDGRSGESRVQVIGRRTSRFELLVWSDDLNLSSEAVARFEAG